VTRIECANPECRVSWDDDEERTFAYCSIECAVYDGVFSVRTGVNDEALQKKIEASKHK
jgi:hypothetical protein